MHNRIVYDKNLAVVADTIGAPFNFHGGRLCMGAFGTFGAGVLALQFTLDADVTWVNLGIQNGTVSSALTGAGTVAVDLPPGRYRVVFAGSTAPTVQYWIGDCGAQ